MKTRHFTILTFLFLFTISLKAQLPNGSIGADFTVTDINNNTHNLYDILDQGKSVILDMSATWCGPCWNYHQTHRLQDLYAEYGPNGTDEIEIFMLEASYPTNTNCLYGPSGCNSNTYGNWTLGVDYPIVNLTSSNGGNIKNDYALAYFPTLYIICPGRKVYEVGQTSYYGWETRITSCNLQSTGEVTNEICYDDGNDEVDLTTTGGYSIIDYLWSNGETTEDLSGFGPGDYSCTITDWYGHSIEVGPFTVEGPSSELVTNIGNQGDVNCNGNNNGFVDINVFGGEPGYEFLWNNNETTEDLNNLSGGTYSVTVTDNFGCSESLVTIINEPEVLTLTTIPLDENCGQQDGSITLLAEGGNGNFTYDIGDGPSSNNMFFNLSAGTYTATVTDDNNCQEFSVAIIEAAPAPEANAGESEEISCAQNTIELDGSGSSSGNNITYTWTTDNGNIVSGEDTQTPLVDQPGTYTISVLNIVTQCESSDVIIVEGSNEAPVSDAGEDGLLNCDIETVTLDGSNSSSGNNIAYEWVNENNDVIGENATIDVEFPGIYWLNVLNTENDCSKIDSVVVTEDLAAPVADAGDDGELNCIVSTVTLDGSGSSTGDEYTYEWQNAAGNTIGTSITIDVSTEGDFTIIVHNAENGCTSYASVTVTASTEFPEAVVTGDNELTCDVIGAALDGSQSSSGDDFSYQWVNENNDVLGTESNIIVGESGTYTFVVSDNSNGCNASTDFIVADNTDAPEINIENPDDLNCFLETVSLDASNSIGDNLSFEWFDEIGTSIGNTAIIDVTNPGTFWLTVINTQNGCESSAQTTVESHTLLPFVDAGNSATLHCNLTSIELDGSNSAIGSQFNYAWFSIDGNIIAGATTLTPTIDAAGTYTLTVLDIQNGCEQSASVEITEIPEVAIEFESIEDVNCYGEANGSISLNISGGLEPFVYDWSNGSATPTIEDLIAGTYSVIVTDVNDCSTTADATITEPDAIELSIDDIENETEGNSNGSVHISVNGGIAPYTYEWMLNNQVISTEEDLQNAAAGEYEVVITDSNGCIINSQTIVIERITATIGPVLANYIDVLPNPTSGKLFVQFDLPESRLINLSVLSITGQQIINTENETISSKNYELDLSDFANGVYILKISSKEGVYTEKIILEKL